MLFQKIFNSFKRIEQRLSKSSDEKQAPKKNSGGRFEAKKGIKEVKL